MVEDFLLLLKKVCENDEQAWQVLKKLFEEDALSSDEKMQAFAYANRVARGNVYAKYIQAFLYDKGFGVKQDSEMAFILMREAAVYGHSAATFEVGYRFLSGIGIEQNYQNAFQWLIRAAESPHYYPAAMYYVGLMYEKGWGVEQDAAKAKEWMEKANSRGYVNG